MADKVCIVTGAGRGIGAAIAREMAGRGYQMVLMSPSENCEKLAAEEVVICAGAFSAKLARDLGEPIPLETERGYHTQIMVPGVSMRHSIIWPARAFMVTPTAGGIRVGARWRWRGWRPRRIIAAPRSP